jgi:hypothetical protein
MITRRDFLAGSVVTLVFVPACGNNGTMMGNDASSGPSCSSQISANHGHVLTVPSAHLTGGMDHTYNIQGSADHTHDVTLTAADFTMLAAGNTVSVTSTSSAGHTHTCMVHCA